MRTAVLNSFPPRVSSMPKIIQMPSSFAWVLDLFHISCSPLILRHERRH
jgi:hypothetical protein